MRGYLANWMSIPPLVFRFQFNPDMLQEKKSYKYEEAANFGSWDFNETAAAAAQSQANWYQKWVDVGPTLLDTKPLEPKEGGQRTFSIDFPLDSRVSGEGIDPETANAYEGSIEPDLAILRSFMVPALDIPGMIISGLSTAGTREREWFKPPPCTLIYGGLSVECVMEDLNIKITAFNDDHTPQRAEISVTLKEQTKTVLALGPILETISRYVDVMKSYAREGFGEDYVNVLPGVASVRHMFEI